MLLLLERVRGRKNYHQPSQTVEHTVKSSVNRYPHTQIRFQWDSCRGTMHQTLITDRGHPKNRYPYILNVRVSCAKPVGLSIVQSCSHLACLQLIATLQVLTYSLSKLMGKYSKASKKEQCRIRRPRSKVRAASRWCRHSTTNRKNKHNWIGGGEGQRMLANKIATYNQLLFFVLLFHIRMIVRRNHLNKKQHFQVNCQGSCYCRICTSMKDYQTLITDRGRPNLMMSLWGTVPFVRHPYEYIIGNTRHVTGRTNRIY